MKIRTLVGSERESEFSNAFIVLPVIYKYHFGNYYLSAGPEMSFLVSAKQKPHPVWRRGF